MTTPSKHTITKLARDPLLSNMVAIAGTLIAVFAIFVTIRLADRQTKTVSLTLSKLNWDYRTFEVVEGTPIQLSLSIDGKPKTNFRNDYYYIYNSGTETTNLTIL